MDKYYKDKSEETIKYIMDKYGVFRSQAEKINDNAQDEIVCDFLGVDEEAKKLIIRNKILAQHILEIYVEKSYQNELDGIIASNDEDNASNSLDTRMNMMFN